MIQKMMNIIAAVQLSIIRPMERSQSWPLGEAFENIARANGITKAFHVKEVEQSWTPRHVGSSRGGVDHRAAFSHGQSTQKA
jgi:hypothetical protein